jgi:TRAP-type C4-dicarboxylate transport system substrate-binding protein
MTSPEIYQSLSRGTLDGVFLSFLSAKPYELQRVAKYATTGFSFGTSGVTWIISDRAWEKLPEDVRKVMLEAGVLAERNFCTYADEHESTEQAAMAKADVQMVELDASQQKILGDKVASVVTDWAKKLQARGLPADRVVAEFREALAKK